jgi:hypothetical protein
MWVPRLFPRSAGEGGTEQWAQGIRGTIGIGPMPYGPDAFPPLRKDEIASRNFDSRALTPGPRPDAGEGSSKLGCLDLLTHERGVGGMGLRVSYRKKTNRRQRRRKWVSTQ